MFHFERSLNRHNPKAALRMFDLITGRIPSLAEQPLKGVERRRGFRELIINLGKSAYIVRYRFATGPVVVVTRLCIVFKAAAR
ncbi:type II toxin-antitoxin system RelE/ParE family toxin [Candidatus Viadribacter manganicus]|uniref:Type II toxin-antitoxin system RelE/ParE family toxin n=1 Tax=Candidatus Viadribacter manganicus TaxID=1759059 RepID=A0A1B1AKF1_9PROT|nr:hypothetical protein ATE48_14470 [Candidatus Viadribacter manganicus]